MIDSINSRLFGAAGYTAAANQSSGKYARDLAEGLRGRDEAGRFFKSSSVKQEELTPERSSSLRVIREKYMSTMMQMDSTSCIISFGLGHADPNEPWDPSEMTDSEREHLWRNVADTAKEMGVDPASLTFYLVPPGVSQRINANPDSAYGDFIFDKLKGGAPGHWLVVDEKGRLTDLSGDEAVQPPSSEPLDDEEDFWEARMKRQAEYIRYIQQARIEHAQEITRQFAELRGFALGSEAAQGLSGGSGGSAASLLTSD